MRFVSNVLFVLGYFLQRAHWLSLDVVLGAMLVHTAANHLPDGHTPASWVSTTLVGIAVFVIYTIDRFLDNRKASRPNTPRHRFYHQHRELLLKIVIGLSLLGIALVFWLPLNVIVLGGVLALFSSVYLYVVYQSDTHHSAQLWKEPFVALIYTCGLWLPSCLTSTPTIWEHYALLILFGLVAFQNLLLFSWFESFDLDEGYSLAIAWGTETVGKVLGVLTVLVGVGGVVVAIGTSHHYASRFALTIAMMSGLTFLLKIYAPYLTAKERYRWLGDGVFLLAVWLFNV